MTNWDIVKNEAVKIKELNSEWTSFVLKKPYKILEIERKRIIVEKVKGGKPVRLSKQTVENAVEKLKAQGRIKKMDLLSSVAREATLEFLHPFVHWDKVKKEFYWEELTVSDASVEQLINEAPNAVDLERVQALVRRRQYQSAFRKNLMKVYDGKCCISNTSIEEVLVAAHIFGYAASGINETTNGLLLRSDLHILFDEDLLAIHPDHLTVHLHPSLRISEYSIYEGRKINERIDKVSPDRNFLLQKWGEATWIAK
jgi:hypothetical protein